MASTAAKRAPAPKATASKSTGKAIATQSKKSKAIAEAINFAADAGAGLDNLSSDDLAIPFIRIVQGGSPIVKRSSPDFRKDAQEGMLLNSVSGKLYSGEGELRVVPCSYERALVEWRQQKDGGGLVAKHSIDSDILSACVKNDQGRNITPHGTEVQETAQYVVLVLDENDAVVSPALISMAGTSLSVARHWNSVMKGFVMDNGKSKPMFSQIYLMKTKPRSKGDLSWFVWDFEHDGEISDADVYQEARRMASVSTRSAD